MAHKPSDTTKMCEMTCCPCNLDIEKVSELVKDPKFICECCGRVANKEEVLCQPEHLQWPLLGETQ